MESPQHDRKISAYECVCVVEGDVQHGWLLHISVTLTAVIAVMGFVRLIDLTVSVCVWSHVTAQSLTKPVITNSPRTVLAKNMTHTHKHIRSASFCKG